MDEAHQRVAAASWSEIAGVFLAYAALTALLTWPWVTNVGGLAIPTHDYLGHVWGLAWVVRQAALDPWHLYDANMYWPHHGSLAYTESLLSQALQAIPFVLLGGGPVLVHNGVLLLTFPLSGLAAYLLARDLGAHPVAAWVGGTGYAFFSFRFVHITQLGVVSTQWFPLVLLWFRRCVSAPTATSLLLLALFCVLQTLSSGYHAVLLAVVLVVSAICFARPLLRGDGLVRIAVALGLAGLVSFAAAWPYRTLRSLRPMARSRAECIHWSARLTSFVSSGAYSRGLLYPDTLLRASSRSREALSPGLIILGMAAAGAWTTRRERNTHWLLALGITSAALALGPELQDLPGKLPGPFDLVRRLPFFDMVRVPSRLGVGAVLAIDVLAALGASRLLGHIGAGKRWLAVAAIILAPVAELAPTPLPLDPPPEPSGFAGWLSTAPRGPVLELPWVTEASGGRYMYWSTRHWQPMVNGHGTFPAAGNLGLGLIGERFPAPYASRVLQCAGIRYVVLHLSNAREGQRSLIESTLLPPGVTLAAEFDQDRVYVLEAIPAADCPGIRERLRSSGLLEPNDPVMVPDDQVEGPV